MRLLCILGLTACATPQPARQAARDWLNPPPSDHRFRPEDRIESAHVILPEQPNLEELLLREQRIVPLSFEQMQELAGEIVAPEGTRPYLLRGFFPGTCGALAVYLREDVVLVAPAQAGPCVATRRPTRPANSRQGVIAFLPRPPTEAYAVFADREARDELLWPRPAPVPVR